MIFATFATAPKNLFATISPQIVEVAVFVIAR